MGARLGADGPICTNGRFRRGRGQLERGRSTNKSPPRCRDSRAVPSDARQSQPRGTQRRAAVVVDGGRLVDYFGPSGNRRRRRRPARAPARQSAGDGKKPDAR